ncbi:MAG: hypothetical protein JJ969_15390 [Rhizobiaceae bacterium]|nr:hypothetical protein [Rhizobiaceae bacterium]
MQAHASKIERRAKGIDWENEVICTGKNGCAATMKDASREFTKCCMVSIGWTSWQFASAALMH